LGRYLYGFILSFLFLFATTVAATHHHDSRDLDSSEASCAICATAHTVSGAEVPSPVIVLEVPQITVETESLVSLIFTQTIFEVRARGPPVA
jgi:hypothetical protein